MLPHVRTPKESRFWHRRFQSRIRTADEFNRLAATFATAKGLPQPRSLTDAELTRVRSRMDELFARWHGLQPDEVLELTIFQSSDRICLA